MAVTPEIKSKINDRAQQISDKQAREIAKNERAKVRFEAHKAKIRNELTNLNQQIAGDAELRDSLAVILPKKNGYGTFYAKDRWSSCTGLPISRTLSQIAVMTTAGIEILQESREFRRGRAEDRYTSYTETVFEPLDPVKANIDGLFSKPKFPVDELPNAILEAVLQSPNKK